MGPAGWGSCVWQHLLTSTLFSNILNFLLLPALLPDLCWPWCSSQIGGAIPLTGAAQNQASRKINLIVCQGQRQEKQWIKEKRKTKVSPFSLVAADRAAVNRSTSLLFICGWIEIILV